MENKSFSAEGLSELSIFELRNLGRQLGVYSPTLYKKEDLVKHILAIINGETQPYVRKNKQGRPPKSLIGTPNLIDALISRGQTLNKDVVYDNQSFEQSTNNVASPSTKYSLEKSNSSATTVEGIVEIYNTSFGLLHTNFIKSLANGIYIPSKLINAYNLRSGDYVKGEINSELREVSNAVFNIVEINGIAADQTMARKDFEELTPVNPSVQIKFETSEYFNGRMIDLFSPFCLGQRTLITCDENMVNNCNFGNLVKALSKNNPNLQNIYFGIDCKPEYLTELKSYDGLTVFCSQFSLSSDTRVRTANLVLEIAKRMVENGKDVVLFVDGIEKLLRAYVSLYETTDSENGSSKAHNISASFEKAVYSVKSYFSSGRNFKEGGSLTIITSLITEESLPRELLVKKELMSVSNAQLVIMKKNFYRATYPPINISESFSESIKKVYDLKTQKRIEDIREQLNEQNYMEVSKKIFDQIAKTKNNKEFLNN